MILRTLAQRLALLNRTTTVAMVGASNNPNRASYFVLSYLRTQTRFAVYPINPGLQDIDGIDCYASLAQWSAIHGVPDLVNVFRRPSELLAITREAVTVGAKAIWYQYDLIDEDAIALADTAGLDVVVDRCLKVETARFNGGLSIGGLDSGLITSKRRQRS